MADTNYLNRIMAMHVPLALLEGLLACGELD